MQAYITTKTPIKKSCIRGESEPQQEKGIDTKHCHSITFSHKVANI